MKRFSATSSLLAGLRGRCPECRAGALFDGWLTLRETCPHCGLRFQEGSGDTWAVVYLSTAGVTGVIIVAMLLLGTEFIAGHRLGLAGAAAVAIVASLPYRKGLAVALEHLVNRSVADGAGGHSADQGTGEHRG